MNIISTTVEYKGMPVKVEDGKVFLRAFGTTIYNHSMHWSWMEIKASESKIIDRIEKALEDKRVYRSMDFGGFPQYGRLLKKSIGKRWYEKAVKVDG